MQDFNKTIRLGTVGKGRGRSYSVYCTIEFKDRRLSISGVEGPLPSGDAQCSCGQIETNLKATDFTAYAPGWSLNSVTKFLKVWREWHLNDMRAGTPEQTEALKEFYASRSYPENDYIHACEFLGSKGLLTVPHPETGQPYKYGSAWLTVAVPEDVLQWLHDLPDTDKTPAWA